MCQLLIFFFKQKTAYEVRISDWSSDVCSSDLGRIIPMGFASGVIPSVPANIALVKNITVIGLYWGYYMGWGRQAPPAAMQARVREAFKEMLGDRKSVV